MKTVKAAWREPGDCIVPMLSPDSYTVHAKGRRMSVGAVFPKLDGGYWATESSFRPVHLKAEGATPEEAATALLAALRAAELLPP